MQIGWPDTKVPGDAIDQWFLPSDFGCHRLSRICISSNRTPGKLTRCNEDPGNQAPIGGLKVVTKNGWFAARPSGTENIYKIYAESFQSASHLHEIVSEAEQMVNNALGYGDLGSGGQR